MSIAPETLDRLTTSLAELVRTGRHLSHRAAAHIHGDLPSSGWALLVLLERGTTSAAVRWPAAPASTSPSPAASSPSWNGRATSSGGRTRGTAGPRCSG
jgi:hypothetical protein